MAEVIRHIRQDEWDIFMQMLEKSYGHPVGYFQAHYPEIYLPDYRSDKTFYVLEKHGKIVSHVGMSSFDLMVEDVKINIGGILGVATIPEERNKGYMERLISHVITEMEKKDISVSVLWGDRHRYGNLGWENAGEKMALQFNERSLMKSGVKPLSQVREVNPIKAVSKVKQLYIKQRYRVDRGKRLKGILIRADNRVWLGDDGYLCGKCIGDKLIVNEVVSESGREASFIMAVMEWCFVKQAELSICPQDRDYISRLIGSAYNWEIRHEGMFRINNCYKFLKHFIPFFVRKASELNLGDFSISFGLRFNNKGDIIAVSYKSRRMSISRKRMSDYSEIDEREGVRYLIGGILPDKKIFGIFSTLLPIPFHIPELDSI